MKITFDCPDKINGLLTMTIEPADYQYGTAVKVDEVNKLMGEKLYAYIQENKIQMLGEPLPNQEKQVPQDFEKDGDRLVSS